MILQRPRRPPPVRPSVATPFPGARSALALLLLINLFNYIDRQVLAAVVGPIKQSFFGPNGLARGSPAAGGGLMTIIDWFQHRLGFKPEDALVGLLGTAFMVVYMTAASVFARQAERRSRWLLVGIGVVLWSLASGASGLAATFLLLLFTRCFVGIGEAAYGPVAPAIISDYYPVKVRGQVLAWFYMAIPVGSALGYVLGGWIAGSRIGDWGAAVLGIRQESWRWAFYLVVVPGLLLGVWSFFMREPPRGQADLGHAPPPGAVKWRQYAVLLRTPSYVFCTLGMAAMTFAIGGIAFWMPYYLGTRAGAPRSSTIIFGAITALAGLTATLLGGVAGDRLRARFPGSYFLVSGTAMLAGFPVFLAVLWAPFPWIWVLIFLTCFCLFFNTGPTNTILANVSHPAMRAAAFALNIFVIHALGDVISPVVVGLLNDWFHDMNKSFFVVGLMFLAAGVFWLLGARHLQRDTERATLALAGRPARPAPAPRPAPRCFARRPPAAGASTPLLRLRHDLQAQGILLVTHRLPEGDPRGVVAEHLDREALAPRPDLPPERLHHAPAHALPPPVAHDEKMAQVNLVRRLAVKRVSHHRAVLLEQHRGVAPAAQPEAHALGQLQHRHRIAMPLVLNELVVERAQQRAIGPGGPAVGQDTHGRSATICSLDSFRPARATLRPDRPEGGCPAQFHEQPAMRSMAGPEFGPPAGRRNWNPQTPGPLTRAPVAVNHVRGPFPPCIIAASAGTASPAPRSGSAPGRSAARGGRKPTPTRSPRSTAPSTSASPSLTPPPATATAAASA